MIVIGITGIIGSGKTTVSKLLKKKGITVVDLDVLAKKIITSKAARKDIENQLGKEYIVDGEPDINKLKETVFVNRKQLKNLEEIIHPRVKELLWKKVARKRKSGEKILIVDAPLLYETDLYKSLNKTIVISAETEKIKERLRIRGLTEKDISARMSNQIPLKEKEKRADFVIYNNGTTKDLEREIERLLSRIKEWEVTLDAS